MDIQKRWQLLVKNVLNPYEYYLSGRLEKADVTPLPTLIETEKHRLQPIHTTGQSTDQVIYHEANEGRLFSSDFF